MSQPTDPLVKVRGGGYPNDEMTVPQLLAWYGSLPPIALVFNVPGALSAANDVSPWVIIQTTITLSRSRMAIKTMPTATTGVNIDILRSTDHGSSFLSIFNTTPTIGPLGGNAIIIPIVDFGTVTLNAGDILRLDVLTVGDTIAGADLMVSLNGLPNTS